MNPRPFKIVNCLSSGFAVAGPEADPLSRADLEMIQWGMGEQAAVELAAKLNGESGGHRPPLHVRD